MMAEGGYCPCNGAKKKAGVFKLFGLGKKKKKKVCSDATNCPKCLQNSLYTNASNVNTSNLNASPYATVSCCDPKFVAEMQQRKEPDYVELPSDRKGPEGVNEYAVPVLSPEEPPCSSGRVVPSAPTDEATMLAIQHHPPHCSCAPCKKKRYDDSLLAMDAQVILQNSLLQNTLSDTAGLVCVIL